MLWCCSDGGLKKWVTFLKALDLPEIEAYLAAQPLGMGTSALPVLHALLCVDYLVLPFFRRTHDSVPQSPNSQRAAAALQSVLSAECHAVSEYLRSGCLKIVQQLAAILVRHGWIDHDKSDPDTAQRRRTEEERITEPYQLILLQLQKLHQLAAEHESSP